MVTNIFAFDSSEVNFTSAFVSLISVSNGVFEIPKGNNMVVGLTLLCTSLIISGSLTFTSPSSIHLFSPETFLPLRISSILLATFLCTETVFLSTISTTIVNVGSCFRSKIVF